LYVAADATSGQNLIATFSCWTCANTIHCVKDAAYILCPACRTLQPTDLDPGWGAGLGFLTSEWNEWNAALAR
jgi:hypothetical protein